MEGRWRAELESRTAFIFKSGAKGLWGASKQRADDTNLSGPPPIWQKPGGHAMMCGSVVAQPRLVESETKKSQPEVLRENETRRKRMS
jgi:hypothetical protein